MQLYIDYIASDIANDAECSCGLNRAFDCNSNGGCSAAPHLLMQRPPPPMASRRSSWKAFMEWSNSTTRRAARDDHDGPAAGGRDATAKQMKGGCDLGCEATASLDAVQRCIWHSEPPCGRTDWTDGRTAGRGQEGGCSGGRVPVGRIDGATKRASSSQCGCACAWLAASHRGMASSTDDELEGFRV